MWWTLLAFPIALQVSTISQTKRLLFIDKRNPPRPKYSHRQCLIASTSLESITLIYHTYTAYAEM